MPGSIGSTIGSLFGSSLSSLANDNQILGNYSGGVLGEAALSGQGAANKIANEYANLGMGSSTPAVVDEASAITSANIKGAKSAEEIALSQAEFNANLTQQQQNQLNQAFSNAGGGAGAVAGNLLTDAFLA